MQKYLTAAAMIALIGATQSAPILAEDPAYSEETLAMLDPTRIANASCGSPLGIDSLQARLFLASMQTEGGSAAMPLFEGVPPSALPVTTSSEQARRYFDQGLLLMYGFNHAGAIRSFQAAQRLDPDCALCFWGEAISYGPNINAPMDPETNDEALAALARAQALAGSASAEEQALIEALAARYGSDPTANRAPLDQAYADAMLAVAARFPAQDDIAILAAEAAMDTTPWDYWEPGGREPKGLVGEAIRLMETVLARNPDHPQAAHLYIHLMENSADPHRAEQFADNLAQFDAESAGHLVHMPAHIYYKIGRYSDSIAVNVEAAAADEAYLEQAEDHGLYRYGYYPHNVHFIVTSAQMAGDMATAIRSARRLSDVVSVDVATQMAWVQPINAAPYFAIAQFAEPERILAMGPADSRLPYVEGMRRYARAVAHAQTRNVEGFEEELGTLRSIASETDWTMMTDQGVPAPDLLRIAELVAQGRLAYSQGRYADAIGLYEEAIAIEETIPYTEPPYWYYPVSQSLGAAYYRAGRYDEARQAFRAALVKAPANGWALYGLAITERALGHDPEAAAAEAALARAWIGDFRWLRLDRI